MPESFQFEAQAPQRMNFQIEGTKRTFTTKYRMNQMQSRPWTGHIALFDDV
jgi:hypothetical protein